MSIISRFGTAVRDRDWGTAVIDVIVVAIGILMALAVDNWNTEREYGAREIQILRRVHEQVHNVEPALSRHYEISRERHDDLVEARRIFYGIKPSRDLSVEECDTLAQSHQLEPGDWRIPAFEELMYSGQLSSLYDSQIRDAGLRFLEYRDIQEPRIAWSGVFRTALPIEFPDLVRVELRATDNPNDTDGLVPGGICDVEGMMANVKFMHAFNENLQYVIQIYRLMGDSLEGLEGLHKLIDKKLNIEHSE
jgi:hypothetical protein